MKKKILCLILSLLMLFSVLPICAGAEESPQFVDVSGTDHKDYANEVLRLINQQRADHALSTLIHDGTLNMIAFERAAEIALYYDPNHLRPDGSDYTAHTKGVYKDFTAYGENIAIGIGSPAEVLEHWLSSEPDRANILNGAYTETGVACFITGDVCCWVQLFGNSTSSEYIFDEEGVQPRYTSVNILPSNLNLTPSGEYYMELEVGQTNTFQIMNINAGYPEMKAVVVPEARNMSNQNGDNLADCGVRDDGTVVVTALGPGTGSQQIFVYNYQEDPLILTVHVPGHVETRPTEPTEHYHSFDKWTVTEFPGEHGEGQKYATCSTCGHVETAGVMYMESSHPNGHDVYAENPVQYGPRDLSIYRADAGHDVFLYYPGAEDIVIDSVELLSWDNKRVIGTVEDLGGGYYHFLMPDEDTVVMITTHRIAAYTITAVSNAGGSVTLSGNQVNEGETVLLTAIPERGYVIDELRIYTDGTYLPECIQISPTDFEITIPDGNVAVEVSFLCTINPFVDVKPTDYFFNPVMWAVSNHITSGMDATHFGPNSSCTRAQVVTFLWRAAGRPDPIEGYNPFMDVDETDYYYHAVLWAVENNITTGMDKTHFGPDKTCTRAQVVTFLWRACEEPPAASRANPFKDLKQSDYCYDAVMWAVENGITTGIDKTHFGPNNTCTRGQVATFLYRTLHG